MNIHEATKRALSVDCAIYRKKVVGTMKRGQIIAIRPTNSYGCCVVQTMRIAEKGWEVIKTGVLWNPTADDLLAKDWECLI